MAPEVHDTSKAKTSKVDIWSLGCILYRMLASNVLFNDPVEVWKYTLTASSSPLAFDNIGLSAPCVSFLHDILQPIPKNRPSAEDCLKTTWITNGILVPEYSIGKDLYTRLAEINQQAPNLHPPPDTVANRTADSSSASQQLSGATMPPRQEAARPWWFPFLVHAALRALYNSTSSLFTWYYGKPIDEFNYCFLGTLSLSLGISSSPFGGYYPWLYFTFPLLFLGPTTNRIFCFLLLYP